MPEIITENDACYAYEIVEKICAEVGPGLPGSFQERERADVIQTELESHLGAENVFVEEFSFAPGAFLGSLSLGGLFTLVAALLNISTGRFPGVSPWLSAVAALALSAVPPLLFLFEFILGFELVDLFFKKKQSVNVIGALRRPGTGNVKRLLILGGHHDSAPENAWLRFLGYGFFILTATWIIGLITMFAMSIIQLAGLITGNVGMVHTGTLGWPLLAFPIGPSIIYTVFFTRGRKNGGNVPGAADNLSACGLSVALCAFLVKNPAYIPEDTEIRFISFGGEEAGLRGSRRYVECHLGELKRLDARMLNFEAVVHPVITILTSDVNGTVRNSPAMVKSLVAAAVRAGVPHKVESAFLGAGSDAGPFSRAGLKAATLLPFKVPQQMVAFYHQNRDCPEVLTIEPLLNVLKLALEGCATAAQRWRAVKTAAHHASK